MNKFIVALVALFTFSQTAHAEIWGIRIIAEKRSGCLGPFMKEELNFDFNPSDVRIVGGASLMAFSTLPLLASLAQLCAAENGFQLTKSLITGAIGTTGFVVGASMFMKGLNG